MGHAALTVAKYFLSIPDQDSGELISNLKLQKLLYYAQGFSVAVYGVDNPIFQEKVYAWKHGPVVKKVYNHYAGYKNGALPVEKTPSIEGGTREFLDEIYRVYGRFSAWALREMTHRESPWLDNYRPNIMDVEIPLTDLAKFFGKVIKSGKAGAA
jgi:uncharacterized phage-associated protein